MELVVLKEVGKGTLNFLGKFIEILFRIILCCIPLGFYLVLIQKRPKASTARAISAHLRDESKFQYIFPGFLLVTVNSKGLDNWLSALNNRIQSWIERNKYLLGLCCMATIVAIMVLSYMRG